MMHTALFDDAVGLHQQGRLEEAEEIYRRILESSTNHAGALHLLGVIRRQQADHEAALELIGRAIALNPQNAVYRSNYGLPLHSLCRFAEALDSFAPRWKSTRVMRRPWRTWAWPSSRLGDDEAAMASFAEALKLEPYYPDALIKLAVLLEQLGRKEEAIRLYEEGIQRRPACIST